MVAVDGRGRTVADLTREDFQVFDGGKPQHIASFRRNDVKPLHALPPEPNELSNRAGTPLSRASVILLDLLNARFEDRAYAFNQLVPALQHVEASDSVFLYVLGLDGNLYPVHPLPDPESTMHPTAKPWTDAIKALLDGVSHKLFGLRPNLTVDERVRMTYSALEALASRVAETPGRKSIIWISHGMPISIGARAGAYDQIDYTPFLQRLTSTLDRANVAVYPVRQPGSLAPGSATPGASDAPGAGLASIETPEEFAGLTGGRAFHTVDITGAVAQAASDARMSYLIAYDPPLDKWDGKYHKIRVACSRKDVRLQTKQGYYAFAADAHPGDQEKAAIETAVFSPFDVTEIGLNARLTRSAETLLALDLEVRIDIADVLLAREGDLFTGQVAVAVAGYRADGGSEASPSGTFAIRLSPEQREQAMKQGLSFTRLLALPANFGKLRVLVYDRTSGGDRLADFAAPGRHLETIRRARIPERFLRWSCIPDIILLLEPLQGDWSPTMFVVNSLPVAIIFCVITMLGWGSWANTQKLAGKEKWPFQLFYWDYAIGVFLFGMVFSHTLGSFGAAGAPTRENLHQASWSFVVPALISGVIFNLSNLLLVVGIDAAGMSVAFPVGVGLALVIGTVESYVETPKGDPALLFAGVALIVFAMIMSALAHKRLPQTGVRNPLRGVIYSAIAGALMGFFYPQLMRAISPNFNSAPIVPGMLTPYVALVVFGFGVLASNFVWNTIFMRTGKVTYGDYFRGSLRLHAIGILGGAIWMLALSFNVLASGVAGPAVSYALGQGATLVAAIWGLFIWREFRAAPAGTNKYLGLMLAGYTVGLILIGAATQ